MTEILTVDTVAMHRLAQRLREVAAQARVGTSDADSAQSMVAALGAPCLVHAAGTFVERWSATLTDLVDDIRRLADAIDLVARAYADVESMTERGLLARMALS
jgi:excreted virulence factor EspC (type VII ESX diderm)